VPDLVVGSNGLTRCGWGGSPEDNRAYHDEEWGRPVHGDVPLFERLVLESFQSGLSWLTILRKRAAFRAAFAGFDIDTVSEFRAADVDRLLGNVGIVRNRAKINATVTNARAARGPGGTVQTGGFHVPWTRDGVRCALRGGRGRRPPGRLLPGLRRSGRPAWSSAGPRSAIMGAGASGIDPHGCSRPGRDRSASRDERGPAWRR
jgi:hypothetical protein